MKKEFLSFLACLLLGVGYILSIMACSCLSNRTDKLFHTINVPLSSEDTLRVSSFIDTFDIVRLETNDSFLLSQVAKVKVVKDRIYVLDIVGNALYVFHLDGSFVGKVSQVGGGPGEYVQLMDFDVSDTSVYLLDFARQNILEFNKEFTYRRSIQYKHIASQFVATDSGFCLYNEPSGKEGEHLFTVMDKKGDVLSEMLPRKLAAPTYNYGGISAFAKHGGVVYYSPIYGNSIYSDSTLVWQIQFGAKSLPEEEDIGNYDISASDFPYLLKNNFWVTTEYVIFDYLVHGNRAYGIYDRSDWSVCCGNIQNDVIPDFRFSPRWHSDGYLIDAVDADIVYEYFDFLLEKEEVTGLTIEDNPLLVLYKLK